MGMSNRNRSRLLDTETAIGLITRSSPSPLDAEKQSAPTLPRSREKKKQSGAAKKLDGQEPISPDFLQQVVQVLPACVAVLDDRGKIVVVNQAWIDYCKENGLSVKKYNVGSNYLQLCRKSQSFSRENGPNAAKGIESVIVGRQDSFYLEYPSLSSNGQKWFQMRISRFHYGGKNWILINHENITEPKQDGILLGQLRDDLEARLEHHAAILEAANLELQHEITQHAAAEQALRDERNRFRTLVKTIPHGIVEHNLDGVITFANAEYHHMHGHSEGALIGRCLWDVLKPIFPDAKKIIEENTLKQILPTPIFLSFTTPDGKSVDHRIDWNYIRDDDGNITGQVAIIADITRQRRAEEVARQHLNQLAHVTRVFTMSQMVSGLAHELNQPLAAIANFAQACRYRIGKSTVKERDALLESIEQISSQADRAGQIIRRLRDFVRRADSNRSRENINDLVDNVLGLLEIEARPYNIRFEKTLATDLPRVVVDRVQVEQVITNLVKNALDATRELSTEPRLVTLHTEINAEGMLQVSVTDSGKGIAIEELNHIFEPFYTTKQSGMGLGLSISRSIVEAHGGRLEAARNAKRGMTFLFTLPIVAKGEMA
jgi:PAS domain S-box-containing protein